MHRTRGGTSPRHSVQTTLSCLVQETDLDEIWKTWSDHISKMPFQGHRILLRGVFGRPLEPKLKPLTLTFQEEVAVRARGLFASLESVM